MQLSFHGAAGDVTGSCHLLEAGGRRILIDCGMFQGSRRLDDENAGPLGFEAALIDLVLLTHAHLDHCGRIPLLVKQGFRGPVYTTAASAELAKLVLMDAAALQQEDRRHHGAHGGHNGAEGGAAARNGAAAAERPPLYDSADVLAAMDQFQGVMAYGQPRELALGVRATFHNAGHILGSATILLEVEESGLRQRLVFSGDLGNRDKPILNPPDPPPAADVIVMESTYGDRNHKSQAESIAEFRAVVAATIARGGNVVIPTFALERAQDLLYYLRAMVEAKLLPPHTPVYLDSPMAISATEIFRRHPECFNAETRGLLDGGHDPFALPGLRFTRDTAASIAINNVRGAVIMAGSGMAAGGRILHHLRHNLGSASNTILFVGYAARGTVARQIIDGARQVRLYGEMVPVGAHMATIGGFSAHADHDDLLAWVRAGGTPGRVFLVHGEAATADQLAGEMRAGGLRVDRPELNQTVALGSMAGTAAS